MQAEYKVVDVHELYELVGYANTLSEVREIAREYDKETKGKNELIYVPYDHKTGKYNVFNAKPIP